MSGISIVPSAAVAGPRTIAALHRDLRRWYLRHRRDLPWRRTRDPYRIWVSEIMLQQTQVATALPFYQSFLERFPTLDDLARAREAEVLAAWSGLGYYRRARHLLAAARTVVREHAGRVPSGEADFGSLPGVGRYTRGAVLSIAFDRALPVLDGNVGRVLARLAARPWSVRDPRGSKALWDLATRLLPRRGPGDWNQALMELGALVCTPRAPRCGECPIQSHCAALARGTVDRYPPVPARRPSRRLHWAAAVVRNGERVLVTRRSNALLDGMWEPPILEAMAPGPRDGTRLAALLRALGVQTQLVPVPQPIRHRITDRDIVVAAWMGTSRSGARRANGVRWVDPARPVVALTGVARKLMRLALGAAGARTRANGPRVARGARKRTTARER